MVAVNETYAMIPDVHVKPCTTGWGAALARPHRTPWMRPSLPGKIMMVGTKTASCVL